MGMVERVGRGTESVWDYPRPPRLEASERRIRVVHGGVTLADTVRAVRILETSHPPVYYLPPEDVRMECLRRSARRGSFCEFKGVASYWDVVVGKDVAAEAAWSYASPSAAYPSLAGFLAFYASRVDECWVDDERVEAQAGDFYGGWITRDVTGPFKGAPGTLGW
jgi:uncharacterized protein (DUF427 family)